MSITYADAVTFVQHLALIWVKTQHTILAQVLSALTKRPSLCPTESARLTGRSHAQALQSLKGHLKRLTRFLRDRLNTTPTPAYV